MSRARTEKSASRPAPPRRCSRWSTRSWHGENSRLPAPTAAPSVVLTMTSETTQAAPFDGVQTVTVDGLRLAYREQGEGEPVVLVHGSASDLRSWDQQLPAIATSYRAIAYSRRFARPNDDIAPGAEDPMLRTRTTWPPCSVRWTPRPPTWSALWAAHLPHDRDPASELVRSLVSRSRRPVPLHQYSAAPSGAGRDARPAPTDGADDPRVRPADLRAGPRAPAGRRPQALAIFATGVLGQ